MIDGLSLHPLALLDDGRISAELGVGGRHIAQALVMPLVVARLDAHHGRTLHVPKKATSSARKRALAVLSTMFLLAVLRGAIGWGAPLSIPWRASPATLSARASFTGPWKSWDRC